MQGGNDSPIGARPLVFMSYSRSDLARARPVIDLLEGAGFDVWWDGRLEGGENFLQTTEAALEGADCVVVLWSATSVASHWVRDEAQRGRERGCLVPLTIDGTMAPLGFRQFQLLDISDWDGTAGSDLAQRILVAVQARTGADVAAPPVSLRPLAGPAATSGKASSQGGLALSRRTLMIGGAGVAGAAGLAGAWQFGLLGSPASAAISMVVLPFANQTGDPDKKYFSDGLSRELRTKLARNPRLKVAAPTSSSVIESEDDFAIGRKLGVGHILRGSVQRDAVRVRVSAELVEIKGGLVRWAETYDRALEDVFAVQSEIAETVAVSLVAEIASASEAQRAAAAQQEIGGTSNVAAYEAFLRGMALYDLSAGEDTNRAAVEQFDAAIAADPNYAAAHAMRSSMLASVANTASNSAESRKLFEEALAAAKTSIAIEPRLSRGHLALGFVLNNGWLNTAEAATHYNASRELAPGDADVLRAVANFLAYGTDTAGAVRLINEVLELDPLNGRAFRSAGYVLLFARDYAGVVERMKQGLALNPSLSGAQFGIAIAQLMQGDPAAAMASANAEVGEAYALAVKAIAAHQQGDAAGSDAALAKLVAYGDGRRYQRAEVHAQRGETEAALALLEEALEVLDPGLLWAPNDPLLDPLRGEPAFQRLLSRIGS